MGEESSFELGSAIRKPLIRVILVRIQYLCKMESYQPAAHDILDFTRKKLMQVTLIPVIAYCNSSRMLNMFNRLFTLHKNESEIRVA